jgi:multidrug resistance efflux pump
MQTYQKKQKNQLQSVPTRSLLSNLLIIAASAGLIAWSISLIKTKFTAVISRDAVINGVLIDLKTPSEGIVSSESVKTGSVTSTDKAIAILKNDRVSKLQTQEITSKIKQQQAELQRAEAKLNQLVILHSLVAQDRQNQTQLETQEAQQSIEQVKSDLIAAQTRYRQAQLNYQRSKFLLTQGAMPQASLDTATLEMQQRKAEVQSMQARLEASQTNKNAARLRLSLDRTASNYDPNIRLQELDLQIADQRHEVQALQQSVKNANAELKQAQADMKRQQTIVVKAPINGLIWQMNAQQGKYMQQGESIGQVLDCNRRWVDVLVDEEALQSLKPGTPATIKLYGASSQELQGKISLVRSGIGRLTAGEEVAIPISANLPRNTQVRVDLSPGTQTDNSNFCYVGFTGRVTFQVK